MNDKLIPYINNILKNILEIIKVSSVDVINIVGESGSGKTFLLNSILRKLQESDNEVIVLKGDSAKCEIDFHPLDDFLDKATKIQKLGKAVVSQLFEEIPIIGKSLKLISENTESIDIFTTQKKIPDLSKLQLHREFAIYVLSVLNKGLRPFVLCDDIQYFDTKTICFLNDLNVKLRNADLPSITFISTINTSVSTYKQSLLEGVITNILVSLPLKEDVCDIMKFWGLDREWDKEEIEMIFTCTGGHLYLLHSIMEYLRSYHLEDVNIANSNTLMNKIITTRLSSFGDKYNEAQKTLCYLSYIGDQVSKNELLCALDKPDKLNDILNISANQNLLIVKDDYIFFCHEIIRRAFFGLENRDLVSFYSKFSLCVKNISPSHYAKRAIIETKAANLDQADILFVMYACQKMRNGLFSEIPDIKNRLSSRLKYLFVEFITELEEAYRLTFDGKNQTALAILDSTSSAYPYPLWIEKQYLICTLQFKNNIREERINALHTIKELVSEVQDVEVELWSRCLILELVLERELNLFEDARITRNRLQSVLSKRLHFDKNALKLLNSIDLYSDTIDTPPVAHAKLRRLVERLETYIENDNYDQIFDLYIAESNLSGNSLIVGEYETAYLAAEKALRLIKQFNLIRFSHPEVCLNNKYLALLYMNHEDKNGIVSGYKEILPIQTDEDKILITTNYAGLLLSQEKCVEALETIITIEREEVSFDIDRYYAYYYQFNYALILYFNGYREDAIDLLEEVNEFVPQISRNLEKYYKKHYALVMELLREADYKSIHHLQSVFSNRAPIYLSAIWGKFKPVYLFSDLQIWTQF